MTGPSPAFDLRNLIHDGGFIMTPLLVCSIVATTVLLERTFALFGAKRSGRSLARDVIGDVRCGRVADARRRCERSGSPLGMVLGAGLERLPAPIGAVAAAVERARAEAGLELK